MLYLLLIGIVMLALLDRTVRNGRLRVLKLETKYKLFALRDELRRAAMRGEIPDNNWLEYMDTTLTMTIERLDAVSLWAVLVMMFRHRKDEPLFLDLQTKMKAAFALEENKKTAEIHLRYRECLSRFLRARHPIASAVEHTVEGLLTQLEAASRREKAIAQTFAAAPETSTLMRYGSYSYERNHENASRGREMQAIGR
jgi:hypothetical protein